MRLNLRLVQTSQFLQQFKLNIRHKPGKEHIIPDALSWVASVKIRHPDLQHSRLDALFTYNTTLVKKYPALVSQILIGYKANPWYAWLQLHIQANNILWADAAILLFVIGSTLTTDSDPHLIPRPDGNEKLPSSSMPIREIPEGFPTPDKSKLLYLVNRLTNVYRLYIPLFMAPDILAIAHREGHLRFSCCYMIITCF